MSKRILTALMAITLILLCGCGGGEESSSPSEITYKVTVKDALGNPCANGTVVKFMQNGNQVAMQLCDENGVASKLLPAGEYSIELGFTGDADSYHYETVTLNSEKYETEILLSKKTGGESL
ncbi:MAG: hypothetical protein J6R49_06290, partial [Clostridia bacterium]|nr:hypothetical protein [Clostridia bacterium]